jgi:HK97 family phage major capsid protein
LVPSVIERLREQRTSARDAADQILTRAAEEQRDLSPDEIAEHRLHVIAEREAADELERARDAQIAELRAAGARNGGRQVLTREAAETARAFRSAIFAKNPQPIEVYAADLADEWPADVPEPLGRTGRVRVHTRDTLKSTATQAMGVDVYGRIVQHMVETSSLMAAGATVVTTATGENLVVPKSTGFVTTNIISEGASITESDPTLSTVTLGATKYSNYFEISHELANDTPTNLLDFLARQAALSLGLGSTGYGDDIINGAGTTEPRGLLLDAGTGVTGPAGTGTTLGTQGTGNQGTDALWTWWGRWLSRTRQRQRPDSCSAMPQTLWSGNSATRQVSRYKDWPSVAASSVTRPISTRSCPPWRTETRASPSVISPSTSFASSTGSASSAPTNSGSRMILSPSAAY